MHDTSWKKEKIEVVIYMETKGHSCNLSSQCEEETINNNTTVKTKENEMTAHEMPSTVIQHGREKDVDWKWKLREGRRIVLSFK